MQIVPAILETSLSSVKQKIAIIQTDGHFQTAQLDIIDGELLPTMTVTPLDLENLDFGHLQLDFHLMTQEPLDLVWELAGLGSPLPVATVCGQVERMSQQQAFLQTVKDKGWKSGLALDLFTPLESIDDEAWSLLDEILFLAVPMGAQGQKFSSSVFDKIKEAQQIIVKRQLKIKIAIDGGIKPEQLKNLYALRVDKVVIGSFLWSGNFADQKQALI